MRFLNVRPGFLVHSPQRRFPDDFLPHEMHIVLLQQVLQILDLYLPLDPILFRNSEMTCGTKHLAHMRCVVSIYYICVGRAARPGKFDTGM